MAGGILDGHNGNHIIQFLCDKIEEEITNSISSTFPAAGAILSGAGLNESECSDCILFWKKAFDDYLKTEKFEADTAEAIKKCLLHRNIGLKAIRIQFLEKFSEELNAIFLRTIKENLPFDKKSCNTLMVLISAKLAKMLSNIESILRPADETGNAREKNEKHAGVQASDSALQHGSKGRENSDAKIADFIRTLKFDYTGFDGFEKSSRNFLDCIRGSFALEKILLRAACGGFNFHIASGFNGETENVLNAWRSFNVNGMAGEIKESIKSNGSPFIIDDCEKTFQTLPQDARPLSALVMPLTRDENFSGIMILISRAEGFFNSGHLELFASLSGFIASQIASSARYHAAQKEIADFEARQEKMVHSEKLKLLGEMATGITHNFNNLLAVILGRVGLLQRTVSEPKVLSSLKIIENAVKDGESIIRRLTAFIPKKSIASGMAIVNISDILQNVCEIAKVRVMADNFLKNIEIKIHTHFSELPGTMASAEELQEVFLNFAFNSIDAMPSGGDLYIEAELDQDENIVISVADTGVGMSQEVQQKLFIPFFTTKGQIGTGLGLSYSYGVLLKHHAKISVESAIGAGTKITVKLPVVERVIEHATEADTKTADANYKKSTVLIIDDDEKIRSTLSEIIITLGHKCYCVSSGDEAITVMKKNENMFDIVFTDLKMPGFTGFDIARYIKSNFPKVLVVLVTGYSYNLGKNEIDSGLIDAVIGKPFNMAMIENTINAAIAKKTN